MDLIIFQEGHHEQSVSDNMPLYLHHAVGVWSCNRIRKLLLLYEKMGHRLERE